jgi:hypothetical protein
MSESPFFRRVGQYLGLVYADDGRPQQLGHRRSRYDCGPLGSPRLDEDIDDLRARLDDLERRLGT